MADGYHGDSPIRPRRNGAAEAEEKTTVPDMTIRPGDIKGVTDFETSYLRCDTKFDNLPKEFEAVLGLVLTQFNTVSNANANVNKDRDSVTSSVASDSQGNSLASTSASTPLDNPFCPPIAEPSQNITRPRHQHLEYALYQPIERLLNCISFHVHNFHALTGKCIMFKTSYLHTLFGSERLYKPDLVAVWGEKADAEVLANKNFDKYPKSDKFHAADIVTVVEVKRRRIRNAFAQILTYAELLPHARPNIAGGLFMTCDSQYFRLYWSDASRFVFSPYYTWKENIAIIFRFLDTLYRPLDDLPQIDPTIVPAALNGTTKEDLKWIVTIKAERYETTRVVSMRGLGKQTWVLKSLSGFYIIKDIWRDVHRRFSEGKVLEAIHEDGIVRGVVRMASYGEVEFCDKNGKLQTLRTSRKHSGVDCTLKTDSSESPLNEEESIWNYEDRPLPERAVRGPSGAKQDRERPAILPGQVDDLNVPKAAAGGERDADRKAYAKAVHDMLRERVRGPRLRIPLREKTRTVLESVGDKLVECTSLLHLLKVAYDIVQIHHFCVKDRKALHRDISKNNILINPKHQDTEKRFNDRVGKYIEEVLDPDGGCMREVAMLIDWDNAALLGTDLEPVTGRTGTPMFIAVAVSDGKFPDVAKVQPYLRVLEFPNISKSAEEKYTQAYGAGRYKHYVERHDDSPITLHVTETAPFEHLPLHDMESLFWLLALLLCRAQVKAEGEGKGKGKKKDVAATCPTSDAYKQFSESMDAHIPGSGVEDTRLVYLFASSEEKWEDRLHPDLQSVAPMLHTMAKYFSIQWVYWKPYLDWDHAHEMMTRVLLDHIVRIKDADVIIDLKNKRPYPLPPIYAAVREPKRTKTSTSQATSRISSGALENHTFFTENGTHLVGDFLNVQNDRRAPSLGKRSRDEEE
ncbi:hypothetical protein EW145_g4568 [Phellinidium pouzarii]|uniref:Fungal-type protein kinase domain-containing protein n=1 Tax=Phellinidium pouzarii TaxID=167371 RepID=A0A4S4L315_9AGAM|nr:hypothetical protein EW145_g4568 [Phellinidium pouzarii]